MKAYLLVEIDTGTKNQKKHYDLLRSIESDIRTAREALEYDYELNDHFKVQVTRVGPKVDAPVLEIDHKRGVLWVHDIETGQTVLRVCQLPKPVPNNVLIDVTHMVGVSYQPLQNLNGD